MLTPMSSISALAASELIAAGVTVFDVRTPSQHAANGLEGSLSVPLARIEAGDLPAGVNAAETLLVVCEFGGFSELAAAYLVAAGLPGARSVRGGLVALRPLLVAG